MESNKSNKIIVVLLIICSFLLGAVFGFLVYPIYNNYILKQRFKACSFKSTDTDKIPETTAVRKDILFYKPGGDELWGPYTEIPEGEGIIRGHLFVDDKPGINMGVELIIANGQKTKRVTVDDKGSFRIPIKKGEYYLNGLIVSYKTGVLDTEIFVNKIAQDETGIFGHEAVNNDQVMAEYKKLEAKYGSVTASQKLAEKMQDVMALREQYRLEVTEKGVDLPDFIYRKPIKIISPGYNSTVTLDNLRFVWESITGAESYGLRIAHVIRVSNGFTATSLLTCNNIRSNFLSYEDALLNDLEREYPGGEDRRLLSGKTYDLRIIAFDKDGNVITASSADMGIGNNFFVK